MVFRIKATPSTIYKNFLILKKEHFQFFFLYYGNINVNLETSYCFDKMYKNLEVTRLGSQVFHI